MKAQLRTVTHGDLQYPVLAFVCPGCALDHTGLHMLPVNTDTKKPAWTWDGNLEAPTINPSILTESRNSDGPTRCHSYLHNGVFQFLEDCTHELKGQHVPMPDLPEWVTREG